MIFSGPLFCLVLNRTPVHGEVFDHGLGEAGVHLHQVLVRQEPGEYDGFKQNPSTGVKEHTVHTGVLLYQYSSLHEYYVHSEPALTIQNVRLT